MCPDSIRDGTGKGFLAKVDEDNRLLTESKADALQHSISHESKLAFQCIGTATLESGTTTALHIENNNTDKELVITYIRHQILNADGGTAFPNSNNYYRISLGRKYSSGGSKVSPINVYSGSGNLAYITAYDSNPTLSGTAREIDRWYTKSNGDMNSFNKEGAVIIPPNETIELSYVGNQTSGIIYTRISFVIDRVNNNL